MAYVNNVLQFEVSKMHLPWSRLVKRAKDTNVVHAPRSLRCAGNRNVVLSGELQKVVAAPIA